MVSTEILLLHTAGATSQAAVAAILVRALVSARRAGMIPRGFIPISVLLSLSSLARLIRLVPSWLELRPPVWLELMTLTLLLITVLSVPAILSAHYLSLQRTEGYRRFSIDWIQWFMIATVVGVFAAFATTLAIGLRSTTPQMVAAGFTLLAVLLWFRASRFRNWQLRKRGLLLFSGLTATALLGISANLLLLRHPVVGNVIQPVMFQSTLGAATTEISNALIVLGVLFVFTSLQLADVIVKRIIALYIWIAASLAVWKAATVLNMWGTGRGDHAAGAALLSIVLIGVALSCIPYVIRRTNHWVDAWVFEIPDFDQVIHHFWGALSSLGDREAVYRAGEVLIKDTLRLAAVRIVAEADSGIKEKLSSSSGPNPRFLAADSPLAAVTSPPAEVLLPLFQEGVPDRWIALSRGLVRPSWTAAELNFVTRIASEIQVRTATVLAEEQRMERLTRESALREQVTDAELRALRAQINPHFLFNSLNTIADLTVTAPSRAEEMTMRLAAVFRYVLVNTDRQFISVREEIGFARNFLEIEETRFENRLRVQFDVDPSVEQEKIPTLLLQPLIENAVKHGISPRREGGTVTIAARRTISGFEMLVADDGVGLNRSVQEPNSSTRVGLENVRKRLATAFGGRAVFVLRPRPGGGTEACIDFRAQQEELNESTAR